MLIRAAAFTCSIAVILAQPASGQPAKPAPAAPKSLLLFYGWPSTINGSDRNTSTAATHFANYDVAVLGDGLEAPTHPDHRETDLIIQNGGRKTQFFGYIPLGNQKGRNRCLTQGDIENRTDLWKKLGVKGVMLDEFGFDYGVNRTRQNLAVKAAHDRQLTVIANAWDPDDVFLPDRAGVAPALAPGDAYLWESYQFVEGQPVDRKTWRAKADKIAAGRTKLPLSVYSVSTNIKLPQNAPALFAYQWFSAAIDGHEATGWGFPNYAAGDSKAPLLQVRPRPALGDRTNAPVRVNGLTVSKATTKGVIEVDTQQMTGKFSPCE